ncbi:MAG TPA: hypothetical protein VG412_10230 [Acidimicrobiales bacterium]|nr:hypothetical protein [Acidimicrobiales bacterium]
MFFGTGLLPGRLSADPERRPRLRRSFPRPADAPSMPGSRLSDHLAVELVVRDRSQPPDNGRPVA